MLSLSTFRQAATANKNKEKNKSASRDTKTTK